MRSLSHLVRGLAALFWGLPLSLIVSVQTGLTTLLAPFGVLPPIVANAVLVYGLLQLAQFQKQERVWRRALERTQIMALACLGLAPFLYWWRVMPYVIHYWLAVSLLGVCGLLFLFNLNLALQRLAAMLPDETLRLETKLFTTLNLYLVVAVLFLASVIIVVGLRPRPTPWLIPLLYVLARVRLILLLLLTLLPVALTMALLWKIKEAILASVFGPANPDPASGA